MKKMVKIEVNGPNVHTETDGEIIKICTEAVLAMNGIYRHIVEDRPDMARILQAIILEQVVTGGMFEDHDESGVLDDIPETATKSRP